MLLSSCLKKKYVFPWFYRRLLVSNELLLPEGGGNAPKSCLLATIQQQKKKKNKLLPGTDKTCVRCYCTNRTEMQSQRVLQQSKSSMWNSFKKVNKNKVQCNSAR